jgi:ketosteroid isomerase-like protein
MSEQNVEIVKSLLEAMKRGDNQTPFEYYDSAIEWDATRGSEIVPEVAARYRGHDGVRAFWRSWLAAWETVEFDVEGVLDAGDSVVALIGDQHLRGRRSGIAVEFPPYAIIFTMRDGKVIRWAWFPDRAEALEAAGLSA